MSQISCTVSAIQAQRACHLPTLISLEQMRKQFNPHPGVCLSRWQEAGPGGRKRWWRELHSPAWWGAVPDTGCCPSWEPPSPAGGHGPSLDNVSSQPQATTALRVTPWGDGLAAPVTDRVTVGSPGLTPSLCASLMEGTSQEPSLGSLSTLLPLTLLLWKTAREPCS